MYALYYYATYKIGGSWVRCNGNILASHAADWGSIPGCGRSASHQTVSGTASAGDALSLARTLVELTPTASSVSRFRVAQGYRKGDEHLRQLQKWESPGLISCILYVSCSSNLPLYSGFSGVYYPPY